MIVSQPLRAAQIATYVWKTSKRIDLIKRGGHVGQVAAEKLVKDTADAGVLFVKMAQFISARGDVLDENTVKALERLQDAVPADDAPPPDFLGYVVQPRPIASASVASVYRGTRIMDGADVAIKRIKRGVRERAAEDLPLLIGVLAGAKAIGLAGAANMLEIVRECQPMINAELDLRIEAKAHSTFRQRFADVAWLRIPKVYEAGESYMISEFVESRKITNALPTEFLARRLFELYIRMVVDVGIVHADPHAGNIGVLPDGTLVLYDYGAVVDVRDARPYIANLLRSAAVEDVDGVIGALTDMDIIKNGSGSRLRRVVPKIKNLMNSPNVNEELAKLPEFTDNDNRLFELTTKYVYLIRSLVIVQGIIMYHDPAFDSGKYIERFDGLISRVTDVPVWDIARGIASDVMATPGSLKSMQTTMSDMKESFADEIASNKQLTIRIVAAVVLSDLFLALLKA